MPCPTCHQDLNPSGQCINRACERFPKCSRHGEQVMVVGKDRCGTCIREEGLIAQRAAAHLSFQNLPHFLTDPVTWLNGGPFELTVPGTTGAPGDRQITVEGRDYLWSRVEG